MDYQKHYNRLIEKAKNRTLPSPKEDHHIIPQCIGGLNTCNNIVSLTPEEHYVAHQLLVRVYPNNKNLIYAVLMMCQSRAGIVRNNKLYGWHKRRLSAARTGIPKTAEHKKKLRDANLGKKLSVETRKKMSNKIVSQETRHNISKALTGRKKLTRTQEHKDNIGRALSKPKSIIGKENIRLGQQRRSEASIYSKKELYILFYRMYDDGYKKKEIKENLQVKERAYYTYISDRLRIENIIKENNND